MTAAVWAPAPVAPVRRYTSSLDRLTRRELEVLELIADGHSNVGIAGRLYLSVRTVESVAGRIFTKLDLPASDDRNRRVLATLELLRHRSIQAF